VTRQRPSIFQLGKVVDDGLTVVIKGWGFGLCMLACQCHRHPTAGHLAIQQDDREGRLGLMNFRGEPCDCCEPWTADELAAILRDNLVLEGLAVVEPLPDGQQ
jgi:hypothetical protein